MELDNLLWKETDSIEIKKLWAYLCTYCYLPRLAGESVLIGAIQTGVNSTEYFAIASGFDDIRYIDLKFNQYIGIVEKSGYLVKVDVAQKQIEEEAAKRQADANVAAAQNGGPAVSTSTGGNDGYTYASPTNGGANAGRVIREDGDTPVASAPKNRRFFMSADLDTTRINRDVQKYVEEIIQHLTSVDGVRVTVSLEVQAESAEGFTQQTVRTISENCRTLRVRDSGFEE
jgi:hypothetical protein